MNTYEDRVNRVIDHIRNHLGDTLTLPQLAKIAHFSSTHFHRVFKGVTGETLAAFTRRARLERALYLMRASTDRELGSIALEVGFGTQSDFSRVFRRVYGIAPSAWDRQSRLDGLPDIALEARSSSPPSPPAPAVVVRRPALRVLYRRVRDPWTGSNLAHGFSEFTDQLQARGVDWRAQSLVGMSWDSEKGTPMERLAYDLGVSVGPEHRASDGLGLRELPATSAVEVHCRSLFQTAMAWDYLYAVWLPGSKYEPAEVPALKYFRRMPEVLDAPAWDLDCSIAIRPQHP